MKYTFVSSALGFGHSESSGIETRRPTWTCGMVAVDGLDGHPDSRFVLGLPSLEARALRIVSCTILLLLAASFAYADSLIDPKRPANLPARTGVVRDAEPSSRVTAVFLANGRRVAVLDGRVVKQGDRFGDLVIEEVLADGVRFTRGGRSEVARLPRQDARVRRSAAMDGE
jgi:MSHA biogenesis protein MshK